MFDHTQEWQNPPEIADMILERAVFAGVLFALFVLINGLLS